MNGSLAVRARDVTKCFGDVVALDAVDLDVATGRVHGLVGPNGAGKSTLLGLLLGLSVADSGSLEILGTQAGQALSASAGVAGFVDGPGAYPWLTARQNLTALARLSGPGARTAAVDEVLHDVGLTGVADDRVRGFSLGMRQRLGLAAALLTRPRLLVLDEPINGLDPSGRADLGRLLAGLAADGVAVVLSSHRMDDVEALCTEVTILAAGRIAFTGPLDKLSTESGDLDYRLVTSDPVATRRLVAAMPGLRPVVGTDAPASGGALVLHATTAALDELVVRLVHAEVAVRELGPVISPLEAAFLALTEERTEKFTEKQEGGR